MDEQMMMEWIERVWKRWVTTRGLLYGASLIIMDRLYGHMGIKVVDALGACGTDVEFIFGC